MSKITPFLLAVLLCVTSAQSTAAQPACDPDADIIWVSTPYNGTPSYGHFGQPPAISADGRFVGYYSTASNLVSTDTDGRSDVFVYDRLTCKNTLVSVNVGSEESLDPSLSDDGQFVTYETVVSNALLRSCMI
jgi:hypothetical protein